MWQFPSEFEASSDQDIPFIKRQSVCELEGDASIDGLFDITVISPFFFCASLPLCVMLELFFIWVLQRSLISSLKFIHLFHKPVQM